MNNTNRKNLITISGFINFPKNFTEYSVANLSVPFNDERDSEKEPIWKYARIKVSAKLSNADFASLDKKRVEVTGYLSGEAFTVKSDKKNIAEDGSEHPSPDAGKDVTVPKIIVSKVTVLKQGEKGKNNVELSTRLAFVEKVTEKLIVGQVSASFKAVSTDNAYKYVNIPFSTSVSVGAGFKDGDVLTVSGFLKGNAFTPKPIEVKDADGNVVTTIQNKEVTNLKLVVMSTSAIAPTSESASTPTPASNPVPETIAPEIDIDEDEIPF